MANVHAEKKLKIALVGCGGRGSGAIVQALTADENTELVAMADAFPDRIEKSLAGIQEHFDGVKKITVNPKHRFSGFDAYKKAIDMENFWLPSPAVSAAGQCALGRVIAFDKID